jgi:hypothetical protein
VPVSSKTNAGGNENISHTEAWALKSEEEIANLGELFAPETVYVVDSYAGQLGDSGSVYWHSKVDKLHEQELINEEWGIYKGSKMLGISLSGEYMVEKTWPYTKDEWKVWVDQADTNKSPGQREAHLYNRRHSAESNLDGELWASMFYSDHDQLPRGSDQMLIGSGDLAFQREGDNASLSFWYLEDGFIKLAFFREGLGGKSRKSALRIQEIEDYIIWVAREWHLDKLLLDPYQSQHMGQRLGERGVNVKFVQQSNSEMSRRGSRAYRYMKESRVIMFEHPNLVKAHMGCSLIDYSKGGILFKKTGVSKIDFLTTMIMALGEFDTTEVLPENLLQNALIELGDASIWRGKETALGGGWTTGRAGRGSRFRSPERR